MLAWGYVGSTISDLDQRIFQIGVLHVKQVARLVVAVARDPVRVKLKLPWYTVPP